MKQTIVVLLAGIACIFLIAAGCTSSSGSAATATPTATPEATTAAQVATTAAPAGTTAQPNAPATPAPNFAGNWNATWNSDNNTVIVTAMKFEQSGANVTGTYTYEGSATATIAGTVEGAVLTGTWKEITTNTTYSGPLVFTLSGDANSFTGTWAYDTDAAGTISNTTNYWNGVRV